MINFAVAVICAIFCFLYVYLILYAKQTPEAQVRRRLNFMIKQAEMGRLKSKSKSKKETPSALEQVLPDPQAKKSFYDRVILPLFISLNERLQKFAPDQLKVMFENQIFRVGKQGIWDAKFLISAWVLSVIAGLLITFLLTQNMNLRLVQRLLVVLLGGLTGAGLPILILNSKIRERQRKIKRQLPEFLDLLCVSVQAGLSFDGAVSKILGRMTGPLIDEFKRMQSDVNLGMNRQYALTQIARRCDIEEMYLFTTSVIQSEKLGTSMSRTLKLQSDNIRERHRQFVKSEAMKAPVKIIFPMVLFIFPSIFVVLLFPAILSLIKTLGN